MTLDLWVLNIFRLKPRTRVDIKLTKMNCAWWAIILIWTYFSSLLFSRDGALEGFVNIRLVKAVTTLLLIENSFHYSLVISLLALVLHCFALRSVLMIWFKRFLSECKFWCFVLGNPTKHVTLSSDWRMWVCDHWLGKKIEFCIFVNGAQTFLQRFLRVKPLPGAQEKDVCGFPRKLKITKS